MKTEKWVPILLVLPALGYLIVSIIYPLFFAIYVSFVSWYGVAPEIVEFVGFKNYLDVVRNPLFLIVIRNTIYFVALVVTLEFVFGFLLALMISSLRRFKSLLLGILIAPFTISPAATGYLWRALYGKRLGVINYVLGKLGISEISWLADPSIALLSLIVANAWQWAPFSMIIILAGLEALPRSPFEAAKIDGASDFQSFLHITLPLLKPVILIVLLLTTIEAFKVFDIVFICTKGGPGYVTQLVSYSIYRTGLEDFRFARAAAFSQILLIMIMGISLLYLRFVGMRE